MKNLSVVVMLLALTIMSGCGGGGSSSTTTTTIPPSSVTTDLVATNLDSSSFPWNNVAGGKLKRWAYETNLIPVKINGSTQATYALDLIEATLGKTIFDRTSIASTADASITRGLIVSMGTAVGPGGVVDSSACGNVSEGPGLTGFPSGFLGSDGTISTKLYVNIGSAGCAARNDIAVHEFGHAIGLGPHFTGFGINGVIGGNFWNIIKTLYNNPIGSTMSTINVSTGVAASDPSSGMLAATATGM